MSRSTPDGPFDATGVTRGPDGIKRYDGLPASLVHLLRDTVASYPDREALVETGGGPRVSYQELWDRSARVAGGLRAAGVQHGDRVALRLGNGVDWVYAFFGTVLSGAVAVPVNTRLTDPEVEYIVSDSGAAYVFTPDVPLPDGEPVVADDAGPDDMAAIFYTSGTTGFPKGAITTHANFLSNCETCRRILMSHGGGETGGSRQPPRNLISVPLFHVTGCNSQLLLQVHLGGTSVIMPQFEVGAFLQAVQAERIDLLTTVPAIYWLAINQPQFAGTSVSAVRALSYGGAPIAPDLVARIMKAFPTARVGNGFGLTETSSVATYLPHEYAAEHADSVGFPAPVCDLRVELPDGTDAGAGEDGRGEVGELLVRGPNVVAGYWNKPEATEAAFTGGWLHTGDLARIDAEGLVYVVDRAKDMINRGGENVYCVEVENALAGAPGVYEAAVVGVPDSMMGEKVGAVLVPAPGATIDVAAVLAYLRDRIADFKVPQYVVVRSELLPRNAGGKLLKRPLRDGIDWGSPVR
ncbi:MAG: AMP-binding protein [Actinomycetota bacterium]